MGMGETRTSPYSLVALPVLSFENWPQSIPTIPAKLDRESYGSAWILLDMSNNIPRGLVRVSVRPGGLLCQVECALYNAVRLRLYIGPIGPSVVLAAGLHSEEITS
jgi:hypothetical protein